MENFNCKMSNLCLRTCFEAIEYLFWDKKGLSKPKKKKKQLIKYWLEEQMSNSIWLHLVILHEMHNLLLFIIW